jgi:tRNA pseudouridine13 synthase
VTQGTQLEKQRLEAHDIHPTAPLWGDGHQQAMHSSLELHRWECEQLQGFKPLMQGLENQRIDYQRRALRAVPTGLKWRLDGENLAIKFQLSRGQFATSILRELVNTR